MDAGVRELANGRLAARAFDDRIGVFVIMEALKRARERGCEIGVYAAATVGEETVKNGAYWSSTRIQPTAAVVVDVTNCTDYSRFPNPAVGGDVVLGGGPSLCNSPLASKRLNKKCRNVQNASAFIHSVRRQVQEAIRMQMRFIFQSRGTGSIYSSSTAQHAYTGRNCGYERCRRLY